MPEEMTRRRKIVMVHQRLKCSELELMPFELKLVTTFSEFRYSSLIKAEGGGKEKNYQQEIF